VPISSGGAAVDNGPGAGYTVNSLCPWSNGLGTFVFRKGNSQWERQCGRRILFHQLFWL